MKTSLRTQIILPKQLRQQIDEARLSTGETLAGYLRRAAQESLKKQMRQREDLARIAEEFVGSVKDSSMTVAKAVRWQREIRRSRR